MGCCLTMNPLVVLSLSRLRRRPAGTMGVLLRPRDHRAVPDGGTQTRTGPSSCEVKTRYVLVQ